MTCEPGSSWVAGLLLEWENRSCAETGHACRELGWIKVQVGACQKQGITVLQALGEGSCPLARRGAPFRGTPSYVRGSAVTPWRSATRREKVPAARSSPKEMTIMFGCGIQGIQRAADMATATGH
jgi:hypothetical protein